jgi:hypothetical protein
MANRLIRALHRDLGYLAVGLTLVYALSGLAVNHVADWDPSFTSFERSHELGPLDGADAEIAAAAAARLGLSEPPRERYRAAPDRLDVMFAHHTLHIDPRSGHVVDEGQEPRALLRIVNWLHENRGKRAWTYAADAYALALIALSVSGLFMIRGRKGVVGRGALLVIAGMALPAAYVALSGGP